MENPWEAGDFSRIAPSALIVSELLCDEIPLYAGQRVLDIGCGSGNTAMAAARRRTDVTAIDPVAPLIEHAKRRATVEHLEIKWEEGTAESLPFADAAFDIALSTFGLIFSTKPNESVAEAARVLTPLGKLVLTSWQEGGLTDQLFDLCEQILVGDPMLAVARKWGRPDEACAMLGHHFSRIRVVRRDFLVRAIDTKHWLAGMKMFLAPVVLAYEKLDAAEATEWDGRILELAAKFPPAPNGTLFTHVPYLEYHCAK